MLPFLVWSLLLTITYAQAQRICPIPRCDSCLDPSLTSAPGVGFHLGLTSGAIAIYYEDDYIEDVMHLGGSPEYIDLMHELVDHPDRLDLPPMDTIAERLSFARKVIKRRVNILFGRPGSPEAATLSSMLTSLRSSAESRLSMPVATGSIAIANAAAVSRQEVNDALSYAGLGELVIPQTHEKELNAAYGAYGFGLCPSYTDPYKCEDEEAGFGSDDEVLHIDYTSKALAANTASLSKARSRYAISNFVDWKLGKDDVFHRGKESDYWDAVQWRIRELATTARRPYTQLLLTGECAGDENFLDAVKDALQDLKPALALGSANSEGDFKFLVARGAAEFQWRRQRGWLSCIEPKYCNETILDRVTNKAQDIFRGRREL